MNMQCPNAQLVLQNIKYILLLNENVIQIGF
jgi:hypothetical protein